MWRYKQEMNDQEYTVDALKRIRTGGRGPDGQIQYKHVSGGLQRPFYMVDYNRSLQMQTKQVYEELVLKVFQSFYRHPFLALVAHGNIKRWIIPEEEVCIVYEAGRKQEYRLLPECVVVAGQVSNVEHKDHTYSNIQEKLNRGIKQRSGHYQKKTGRAGRKNRAAPASLNMTVTPEPMDKLLYSYSWPGQSRASMDRKNKIFEEVNRMTYDKIQPRPKEFNAESNHSQPRFNWASWQRIR
ncbi:54S ribosomal protein L2 mitochondrial [Cichlidogyrus casuarinus]|uniref:54S ribosomal protein L2 mitochondrial n=1 Tax=Cichlidogyrus casuarinus TaxID=1844966 RepID=A0ABD2Q0W2_9PLAT